MATMSHERDDHGRRIPSWDGRPDLWEQYKDEVRIWTLGSAASADYSLAARLVSHLRGPAKRIGMGMTDEELEPRVTEAEEGGRCIVSHKPPIQLLMTKLEVLAPQQQERRGTYFK